jgi:hypothetical protein
MAAMLSWLLSSNYTVKAVAALISAIWHCRAACDIGVGALPIRCCCCCCGAMKVHAGPDAFCQLRPSRRGLQSRQRWGVCAGRWALSWLRPTRPPACLHAPALARVGAGADSSSTQQP